jgi:hypothetical protein
MPGRVLPLPTTARLLGEATAAFLAQPDLAASTRRSYQQTLGRLEREFGADQQLTTLTAEQMTAAVTGTWAGRAPATWNRHVATIRSFLGFCRRRHWLIEDLTVDLERRPEPTDRTKAIPAGQQARAGALQGRRHRLVALPNRFGSAAPAADRWPGSRAAVPGRPRPCRCPGARRSGPLP